MLPDTLIADLETALDVTRAPEVPGAAVAILSPDGDWFGASGVSDLANNTPLQPDDRFEAGSITKTFIATAILQLVEEGQLSLEDTLTDWLPPYLHRCHPQRQRPYRSATAQPHQRHRRLSGSICDSGQQ